MRVTQQHVTQFKVLAGGAMRPPMAAFTKELEQCAAKPHLADANRLHQLYQAIPTTDRTGGTKTALAYVVSNVPELATAIATAEISARTTKAAPSEHWYFGRTTQTCDGFNYDWPVPLKLTINPRAPGDLYVSVQVHLIDDGGGIDDKLKNEWRTALNRAWSDQFSFTGTVGVLKKSWSVKFQVEWVDGAVAANRRYDVKVKPASADVNTVFTTQQLNMARTMGGVAERQMVAQHKDQNTLNMGEWGRGDMQAILHEFGHMVGCPDEYLLTACGSPNNFAIDYDASYNVAGYTTDSVMNNPKSTAKIYPRHLTYVKRVFEAWQALPRDTLSVEVNQSYKTV